MPSYCCNCCEMTFRSNSQLPFHQNSKNHKLKSEGKEIEPTKPKRAYNKKVKDESTSLIPDSKQSEKDKINKIKNHILSFD